MDMVKGNGKTDAAAFAKQLIAGANKNLANVGTLPIAGGLLTLAQAVAELQKLVDLRTSVETAQAQAKAAVATEVAQLPALRAFMSAFVTFVKAAFGNQPGVLADFGMQPKKVAAPPTVQQRAAAAAKREATRAARGTKGSKAKQAIKGDVTGVVVTPVTAAQPGASTDTSSTSAPANAQASSAPAAAPAKS
jgi:hypothetical protein